MSAASSTSVSSPDAVDYDKAKKSMQTVESAMKPHSLLKVKDWAAFLQSHTQTLTFMKAEPAVHVPLNPVFVRGHSQPTRLPSPAIRRTHS